VYRGLTMLKTWMNVNVDIDVVTKLTVDFFKKRNFDVQEKHSGKTVVINVFHNLEKASFAVNIRGDERSFEVEFAPNEPVSLRLYANLFSAFGGGHFVLKRVKSEEVAAKIESEFWLYISGMIEEMRGGKLKY